MTDDEFTAGLVALEGEYMKTRTTNEVQELDALDFMLNMYSYRMAEILCCVDAAAAEKTVKMMAAHILEHSTRRRDEVQAWREAGGAKPH